MSAAAAAGKGQDMRRIGLILTAAWTAAALGAGPALAETADAEAALFGTWRNPKNTVHLDIRKCGAKACGYVVWASEKAQADAKKGSGKPLVGMQLFQSLKQDKSGVWRGRVFVPDQNRSFSGSAEPIDDKTLRAKGCLFGSVLCKTQLWKRVS
jgi:uncharacterized protein (DUF2147 family)